jgi:hypothetical protein
MKHAEVVNKFKSYARMRSIIKGETLYGNDKSVFLTV